jgi:hypothetical protein
MSTRSITTKDVALLHHLSTNKQLALAPEFQRNAVWPTPAKAYLLDTIINDRPIPLLFFQRSTSIQSGRPTYIVIDGQQRLRTIFDFLDGKFRLTQSSKKSSYYNKRFSDLSPDLRNKILNYDLIVQELSGYSDNDIRDMFVRMNRYVFKLSRQELRHAKASGPFHKFVEKLGTEPFWNTEKVFSRNSIKRMRAIEFAAELAILLIEGPQDKKSSVDVYYAQYRSKFPYSKQITSRLHRYLRWIKRALPELKNSRYRSPVDLYSLVGALDIVSNKGKKLASLQPQRAGADLLEFDKSTRAKDPTDQAARYLVAASRQTDNLIPRTTRIEILEKILRG